MAQAMKANRRLDVRTVARRFHRANLPRSAPWFAIGAHEQKFAIASARHCLGKELHAIIVQDDVARLAALAQVHRDGAGVVVEVAWFQPAKLAPTRAAVKTCLDHIVEVVAVVGGIEQTPAFIQL